MRRSIAYCLAGGLTLVPAFLAARPPQNAPTEDAFIQRARGFIAALEKGDFQASVADFDAAMTKALSPEKMAAIWKQLAAQLGPFKKQAGARREQLAGYEIAYITLEFEKDKIDAKVVMDTSRRIAGLNFVPSGPPPAYAPPKYADPALFEERDVTVGAGEWALPGTLSVPRGSGPFPALVLVHGSGGNDRDETLGPNKAFKDLAWGLASRGIAVLRYEKRTKQYGPKIMADKALLAAMTVKEETVDDALEAVKRLKATAGIDPQRIFVLGHSLGGMLVPRIAVAGKDLGIAGFIVMAGATQQLDETILRQMTYIYSLDGSLSDAEKKQLEDFRTQIALIKGLKDSDAGKDIRIMNASPRYWLDLRGYNPPELARQVPQPILILQGSRDYQVTIEDFENWKKALGARPNVEFKLYEKLNHMFYEGQGFPTPNEYTSVHGSVAEYVIADIAAFVKKP
jgi:dienelactone hydrolase